ncbi:MAG: hypothetical protein QXG16_05040 [Candidatus Anstonellaceae archaeon]
MNKKTLYIIIGILVLVIVGGFFFLTNKKGGQKETQPPVSNQGTQMFPAGESMVDCGVLKEPSCFFSRMNNCQPVKAKLTGSDGSSIEIAILGIENEKCHFQRKINGVLNLDCYFPKGTLNPDTIDQTFGNDKGPEVKKIVDEACKSVGW